MASDLDGSINTDQDSKGSKTSRDSKGKVYLDRLIIQMYKGIIKNVKFNKLGQPIGSEGAELQSYIGVLTRRHIKVSYELWKDVPEESKDLIWDSLVFNIDDNWKKKCLCSANTKWRQWKSSLYSKHIVPFESTPEKLYNPPPFSGILKEDWRDFVISRMSDVFRKKSKDQKERREKHIYPHHTSRKGYADLREEIKDKLTGDEEVDRAMLWKQARANKKGEFEGEMLKEKIDKIDEYTRQKEEGVFHKSHPKEDILTKSLDKPEYSGRVRAVGAHIAKMNAKTIELQQHIIIKKDTEEKGNCSVKNLDVHYVEDVEEILHQNVKPAKKQRTPKSLPKLKATNVPKVLKMLHSYSRFALNDGLNISIPLADNVFGNEVTIYIFFEDVNNMCELNAISAACLSVYIWHLYKECENENLLDRFRFANLYEVSINPKMEQLQKVDLLAKRLIGTLTNQLVLVPCNEERGRKNVLWEKIKCPQQPDGNQCGFYVMRYMKDIIENCGSVGSIPLSSLVFYEGYYSKTEIDEVRTEWAEFVQHGMHVVFDRIRVVFDEIDNVECTLSLIKYALSMMK
ncbi:hypothetical protein C2S51_007407 [Perilla frutescens var. frutescens]|nr:hypothetical protein C2S51_007407 [Perilla frutescens var. frutescens]